MAGVCYSVRMCEDTNFNLLSSSWAPEGKTWLSNFVSGLWGYLQLLRPGRWAACPQVVGAGESPCAIRGEERGFLDLIWVFTRSQQYLSGMTKAGGVWHPMAAVRAVPGTAVGHKGTFAGLIWCPRSFDTYWGLDLGHCGGLSEPHARSPTALLLLHTALPEEVWIMPRVFVGL